MVGVDWLERSQNIRQGKRTIKRYGRRFRRKNFIGDGKANYCHQNAAEYVKKNGGTLYYGLAYTPDVTIIGHSWPVVDGVLQEVTKNCETITLYVGVPVKDELLKDDEKYTHMPVREIIDWNTQSSITGRLGLI